MPRPIPFVVVFQGRSGSTWVIESLQSHPRVIAKCEALVAMRAQGGEAQSRWARSYLTRRRPAGCLAVGFKTKLEDVVDREQLAAVLRSARCRIVRLARVNVVKQAISWFRAEWLFRETAEWNLYEGTRRPPALRLDAHELTARVEALERDRHDLQRFVTGLGLPVFDLEYERLLTDPDGQFQALQLFLGLPPRKLRASCLKATDDDLRGAVLNWEELRERVSSPRYRAMLDEGQHRQAGFTVSAPGPVGAASA